MGEGGGEGSRRLLEEGGGGIKTENHWIWDNSNKYKVAKLTKYGKSLVSLWYLCRVWNNTTLLCAHNRDTETGPEEEEEEE